MAQISLPIGPTVPFGIFVENSVYVFKKAMISFHEDIWRWF